MRYARLDGPNNMLVVEFFETDRDIYEIFNSQLVWVAVPDDLDVQVDWTYENGQFSPPVVHVPTPEEIQQRNSQIKIMLKYQATENATQALLALQLGNATDDETVAARRWQDYYRALDTVDLTVENPDWPSYPS